MRDLTEQVSAAVSVLQEHFLCADPKTGGLPCACRRWTPARASTAFRHWTRNEEFLEAARQLRSAYKDQTGFVDLLSFISEDCPGHALVVAVKSDSQEFYKTSAPPLDLKPFLEEQQIEHYYLETSSVFQIARGKAAVSGCIVISRFLIAGLPAVQSPPAAQRKSGIRNSRSQRESLGQCLRQ